MTPRFAGRVAIVTGGASGIGAATVAALAADGARVVLVDVDRVRGEEVAGETGAELAVVDVADAAALGACVAATATRHGRLDVLVSNAFAAGVGAVDRLPLAEWQRTLDVTLTPVFAGLGAYNAAKAGVINLTRTAALELAPAGIRVNAVCPGLIATPSLARAMGRQPAREAAARAAVPLARFGLPAEVARAILFLASDDAAYVTGTTLVVDGGLTAGTGIPALVPGA